MGLGSPFHSNCHSDLECPKSFRPCTYIAYLERHFKSSSLLMLLMQPKWSHLAYLRLWVFTSLTSNVFYNIEALYIGLTVILTWNWVLMIPHWSEPDWSITIFLFFNSNFSDAMMQQILWFVTSLSWWNSDFARYGAVCTISIKNEIEIYVKYINSFQLRSWTNPLYNF